MTEVKNDRLHGLHVHEVEVRGDLGEVSTLRGTFQDHRLNFRTPERPLIPVKTAMSKRRLGRRGWEGIQNLPTPKSQKQTLLGGAFGELGPNLSAGTLV